MTNEKDKNTVEQYYVKISPYLDEKQYKEVMSKLNKDIMGNFKNTKSTTDQSKKLASAIKDVGKNGFSFNKIISGAPGKIALIVAAVKVLVDTMKKLVTSATEFSNNMITANSAFVNKNTRNLMAQFGVDSQTATGIGKVTNLMGISTEDLARMTPGQMSLYSDLMKQWQNAMNSIDPKKMDKFNEVTQNFQKQLASAKLEIQIQLQKMLIDLAPTLQDVFDSIINLVRNFATFVNSPIVKNSLKILGSIFSMIINFLSVIVGAWGNIGNNSFEDTKNGSTTSNVKVVQIDARTNNSFTGESNTMFDMATNLSRDNYESIQMIANGDGRQ